MKTFKLNPEFVMTVEEIESYNALPDNLPTTFLKPKQKDLINQLYRKYITQTIDNIGWAIDLYKDEMKEKWPSGSRMKEHEAKRIVLNNVVQLNEEYRLSMDSETAASYFLNALNWRKCAQKVINAAYQPERN